MSSKIESIICPVCGQLVLNDAIFCDLCYTWIHFKCSNLNKKTLTLLSKSTENWYCTSCVYDNIPLSNVPDDYITSNTFNSCIENPNQTFICFCCNRTINNWYKNSILCSHGKHRLHLKCANMNNKTLKLINPRIWSCSICNNFPFSELHNNDLNLLNFNSLESNANRRTYTNQTYQSSYSFDKFKDLPKLEIDNSLTTSDSIIIEDNTTSLDFDYYKLEDFLSLKSKLVETSSFFHTNIRSIKRNIDELSSLIHDLDFNFDFIGLSETWQNSQYKHNTNSETLAGYHPLEYSSGQTQNSGCGLFIKENINHSKRSDLSCSYYSSSCEFQSLFVEIHNTKSRNFLVGVIYRHPLGKNVTDIDPFLSHMKKIMMISKKENKEMIIMGDFNLDFIKLESRPHVNLFLETMLSNFFYPHIVQPTRFSDDSNYSLIDNIFYNSLDKRCISGNLLSHISDHLPNFLIIDKSISYSKTPKRFKRDFSKFNLKSFKDSFEKLNLNTALASLCDDTNCMYDLFHECSE